MSLSADVIVVGAGVVGSSVAYELARAGRNVVVIDKGLGSGQGSTSASSGVVRFNYSTRDGVVAAWESYHLWRAWREHLGDVPDGDALASLVRTGVVVLDVPVAPRSRAVQLFAEVGVPYEEWDPATLRARVPGLSAGRFWPPKTTEDPAFWDDPTDELGALFTPDGGFIDDAVLAARNLADAAARHGATFMYRTEIAGVSQFDGRVVGVEATDGRQIAAPVVVNCAGPWSSQINRLAGVGSDFTIAVRPMRQEVHQVLAPPGYNTSASHSPVIVDLDLGTYLRPAGAGHLLIGGTEPRCDPFEWIDNPDESDPRRTAAKFEAHVLRAARRFPELSIPSRASGIAGVYDVTTDWAPIYDRTDLTGFYVAIGTSGNQFKNAPLVGMMMERLIAAVEAGHDHDEDPLIFRGPHTGQPINLGSYSRRRQINPDSSGTVLG